MEIGFPIPFPVAVSISVVPTIAFSGNPEANCALVQVATFWKLIDREIIRILATLAIVLVRRSHLTGDIAHTILNDLDIAVMSQEPTHEVYNGHS
ncbi:MAG: hypothetical protein Q7K26_04255 [bacterium]|nr:hypothetical protein [bacterium]